MTKLLEDSRPDQDGLRWMSDAGPGTSPPPPGTRARPGRGHRLGMLLALVGIAAGITAIVFLAVLPAIRQSRKDRCLAQLREIGQALIAYEQQHRHYPPAAICDDQGRPLLSWRVAILPHLGLYSLYDEFHKDEPWDSPHNRTLLDRMPPIYRCPGLPERRGFVTGYQVVVGPKPELGSIGTLFEWSRGIDIREVIDGTSSTVAVIETKDAIPWTRPGDPMFDRDAPLPEFGSGHEGGFHAVFADGWARFVRSSTVPQILRALVTRDGNEVVGGG